MTFADFKRVTDRFGVSKFMYCTDLSDRAMKGAKFYRFNVGVVNFSFLDEGKDNGRAFAYSDILDFSEIFKNNSYGIFFDGVHRCNTLSREGFILLMIDAFRHNGKNVGELHEVNSQITRDILEEVDPFALSNKMLSNVFIDDNLKGAVKCFDDAVNPFGGKSIDDFDDFSYPPNVSITGRTLSKDGNNRMLEITDLKTGDSVRYTTGEKGVSYRLNYFFPEENRRFEIIHNYSDVSERIKIRVWYGKKLLIDWDYDINTSILKKKSINHDDETSDGRKPKYTEARISKKDLESICSILNNEVRERALAITGDIIKRRNVKS